MSREVNEVNPARIATGGDRGAAAPLLVVAGLSVIAVVAVLGVVLAAGAGAGADGWDCAGGGTGQQVAGVRLDAEQMGNASTIVEVAAGRGLPAYAAVVAVATAAQESTLRNVTHGDTWGPDSAGLFQQRPSAGWGTRAQVLDPVYAAGAFLDALVRVPGWRSIPLTQAAQMVQRSRYPNAYARWQAMAADVVSRLWPAASRAASQPAVQSAAQPTSPARSRGMPAASAICPGDGAGDSTGRGVGSGTTRVPAGFVITGSPAGQAAVRFALAQLGKPYRWGAAGPGAFDCSGLTMAAWARGGVALPHFTGDQIRAGSPAPTSLPSLAGATGGDLVFIPGSLGSRARPRHVAMVAGYTPARPAAGDRAAQPPRLYLVQAPQSGMPVKLTPATAWAGEIVAVRRLG